jgi:hypothetical protein
MSTSLKQRVEVLEGQVKRLISALESGAVSKDWRSTFGASANDAGFEEMVRLGQEYRRKQRPGARRGAGP